MSRFCEYELHGWNAEGKPLPEALTDKIIDKLDEIGTDDCTIAPLLKGSYITTFQSETQDASNNVDNAFREFSKEYPGILLEMDYRCRDEDIYSRTRYKNGEVETVDAVVTFPPFQMLLLPVSAWILTDSDTGQHIRPLGGRRFECIDMGMKHNGICYVSRRIIDLNDYKLDEDFCHSYLRSYGYDSVEDVRKQYGDAADQIIVECIFETEMWEQDNIVYAGTEDACRAYIVAVVQTV